MSDIRFDENNVYVINAVPTRVFLKVFIIILNFSLQAGSIYFATLLQEDGPIPLAFLLPIFYFFTLGKLLMWNSFGKELMIISTSHISYQHDYGIWKTKLVSNSYQMMQFVATSEDTMKEKVRLHFVKYNDAKLTETVYESAISLTIDEYVKINDTLNNYKLDENNKDRGFPIFIPN
ncbi:MAG: hypothetical protein REI78_10035 [Pedobacter sp.]|nr:hypothetical protein [Pedobacter sp.]